MSKPAWIVTAEELVTADRASLVIVDVREPDEWAEGRIEGAVHIPLGELSRRAAAELPPGGDLVLYCAHGIRSLQAVMALRPLGFARLRSLEGGIEAWGEARGAIVR